MHTKARISLNPGACAILLYSLLLPVGAQAALRTQAIPSPLPAAYSDYGYAIATDGQTLVVGAPSENSWTGAAYVFEKNGPSWQFQARLVPTASYPSEQEFGESVDVDNGTVIVGASGYDMYRGAVYVFQKDPLYGWSVPPVRLAAPDGQPFDYFGTAAAIDGDTLVAGAYRADDEQGAAYVFSDDHGWMFEVKLFDPDGLPADGHVSGARFGNAVAIDGDRIVVGACYDWDGSDATWRRGAVCVFERLGEGWNRDNRIKLVPGQWCRLGNFGRAVAVSGDAIAVGSPKSAAAEPDTVHLYRRHAAAWMEEARLVSPNPDNARYFGDAVSLDGNRLLVGDYAVFRMASACGSAYLYEWDGSGWGKGTELLTGCGGDRVGSSVAVCGNHLFIGANGADDETAADAGMVYTVTPCNYHLAGDLDNDCRVTIEDFAMLSANWLTDCMAEPANANCL